jgi:hypothetical protein
MSIILLTFYPALAFSQTEFSQTVRGTITDAVSKTPLIGATIVVGELQPVKGTTADRDANFRLNGVPVGRHNFNVSYFCMSYLRYLKLW